MSTPGHLMRRIGDLLLPPLFTRLWRRFRGQATRLTYYPGTWLDFQAGANIAGWNAPSIIEAERSRWEAYCRNLEAAGPLGFSHEYEDPTVTNSPYFHNLHMTFAYVLARVAHGQSRISVLDYGGSLGHYQRLARALLPMVEFEYHVKEVPAMAEAGRTLNTEVIWHQDESCLDRTYDLIVVNSSLQYVENWQERLGRICKATGRCLLLTRLPVVERHPSFPAVQTTQGAKILCWMLNRDELLKTVRDSGLTLVREVVSGDPVPVAGAPENAILKGWVFENRKA